MAATPQIPRFNLPQAEYLNLAPNVSIALQGRRRFNVASSIVSVAASTTTGVQAGAVIESPFPPNSGIYLHDLWTLVVPQDHTGFLQLVSYQAGFGLNATAAATGTDASYRVTVPIAVLATFGGITTTGTDRDKLILHNDILPFEGNPDQNVLTVNIATFIKNTDGAAAHSILVAVVGVYTRLDGIIE